MAGRKYDDLSKEEFVRLLEFRDRRDATRFGLVWEANEIERDKALNDDFVALDLDKSPVASFPLCRPLAPGGTSLSKATTSTPSAIFA